MQVPDDESPTGDTSRSPSKGVLGSVPAEHSQLRVLPPFSVMDMSGSQSVDELFASHQSGYRISRIISSQKLFRVHSAPNLTSCVNWSPSSRNNIISEAPIESNSTLPRRAIRSCEANRNLLQFRKPICRETWTQCVEWRRVLYEKQPFDDSYVDPLFLSRHLTDEYEESSFTYSYVAANAFSFTQEICFVTLILSVWYRTLPSDPQNSVQWINGGSHDTTEPPDARDASLHFRFAPHLEFRSIGIITLLMAITGQLFLERRLIKERNLRELLLRLLEQARRAGSVALLIMVFTPVLADLSSSFASDTVGLLTTVMLFIHIMTTKVLPANEMCTATPLDSELRGQTEDHLNTNSSPAVSEQRRRLMREQSSSFWSSSPKPPSDNVRHAMFVNTATYAACLLGSRLANSLNTFGFINFVFLLLFFMGPSVTLELRTNFAPVYLFAYLPSLVAVTCLAISTSNSQLIAPFLVVIFAISFVVPFVLVASQELRRNRRGPWDIPDLSRK